MAKDRKQSKREQAHGTQPKRKRRPRRRLRTGNSKVTMPARDNSGRAIGDKVIYQGNDTVANRLWATMLDVSGVLSMAREG